jgi:HEAT repeat protein
MPACNRTALEELTPVDEQTRRQITWIVLAGAAAALMVMAAGRRGEVSRLRTELIYGSPEVRQAAAERLVETQKLAEAVADQPRWLQDNVVDAVTELGTEKALFQVMSIWTVIDSPVQPRLTAAVARFGPLAIPPMVEALVDKDAKIRAGAPGVLTAIGEPVVPYLLPLMDAWDDYIRTGVATVFGGIAEPVTGEMVKVILTPPPSGDQQGEDTAKYLRRKECATSSLTTMAVKGLDAIIGQLLPASDPEVRGLAAALLGTIGAALKPEQQPQAIIPLLQRMAGDPSWAVRRKAATALGGMGAVAVLKGAGPALTARLKDERPEVRAAAAEALGKVAAAGAGAAGMKAAAKALVSSEPAAETLGRTVATQAANVLAALLTANTSGANREISAALVRIGPASVGPLQPGLASASGDVRLWAASTIAQIGGPAAVVPLARALADPAHANVRKVAAEALRNQPAEALNAAAAAALPSLSKALQDPDSQVYYAARDALAKMGQPAVPVLVQSLASSSSRVGYMAEMALARIGAPAVSGLVSALRSSNPTVVNWASIALGDIAEPSVQPLSTVLRDGSAATATRAAAARALGDTGMAGALQPLLNSAKDKEPAVRVAALNGLGELGDPGATATLVAGLGDADVRVRQVATGLLKNWRMGEVQDALKKTLGEGALDAQRRAAVVLVFQNSSVTNQLLREIAVGTGQVQVADAGSLLDVLHKTALDPSALPDLRRDAILSIGFAGDEASIGQIEPLLAPGDAMALPAAKAVAQISARLVGGKEGDQRQQLGEGATRLVDLVMQGTDPELQLAAATGLATMEDIPVKVLVDQLAQGTDEQRAWAGGILAAIGKPATELLMRVRGATKDAVQKTWCAATLTVIGDSMALQIMKHLPQAEQPLPAQVGAITARVEQIRQGQS